MNESSISDPAYVRSARVESAAEGRQLGYFWGGISLFLVAVSPLGTVLAEAVPACLFKTWLGIPCPTCGTTRAALALSRFDFTLALTRYPLQSLAWIVFLVGGWIAGFRAWRGLPLPRLPQTIPLWARIGMAATVAANWAYAVHLGI